MVNMSIFRYLLKNWEIGTKSLFARPSAIFVEGLTLCFIAILQIIFVWVLTTLIPSESRAELMLFLGTWQIANSIYGVFFAWSHDRLNDIIYDGQIDFLLLRPINAFYSLSFGRLDISNMFTIPIGIVLVCLGCHGLGLSLTIPSLLILCLFILLATLVIFLFYSALELTSIFTEGILTLIPIAENLVEFGSHPVKKYTSALSPLFPIIAAINLPAEFVVEALFSFKHFLPVLLTIGVLALINVVLWRYGLKHYCGASS